MYVWQMGGFILDAAILFLYSLIGTIPAMASAYYLAAGLGWTLVALIPSELQRCRTFESSGKKSLRQKQRHCASESVDGHGEVFRKPSAN